MIRVAVLLKDGGVPYDGNVYIGREVGQWEMLEGLVIHNY